MILVDSSVWIDFFRGTATPQVETLDSLLGSTRLAVGDLIMAEVLQGVRDEREFNLVRRTLEDFTLVDLAGKRIAIQAVKNFRVLTLPLLPALHSHSITRLCLAGPCARFSRTALG